ncbi:unnamed protein product (macronuclear) [Paramecium tetraurelia]|uniref:F-box domain-containing protein n=1 Tax=Paramecium tetraurelia TaxID=5888 RepID=A0BNE8_PARTE|nr:uncharacterized protein GSPATT00030703001 [Paramecium tetraurelia]CAK60065.1 unnamed protein product [Paramecium tetraurelia]|eukprot:XP_001427463.1 hypothetical protein (macronuclear) [Paramecium tetraurelia strain d4-2]
MSQDNIFLKHSQQGLRQKQQITQKQTRTAFNAYQNLFYSFQNLTLPKSNLKDNLNKKQPQPKFKLEKYVKTQKQQNLFGRFVSQIVFRNIMVFLSTQDLMQLRLVSILTNHLIEANIEFLYYIKIQRQNYVKSLNIQDFQQPVIPSLNNILKQLRKLMSINGSISQIPSQQISQFTLLADLYMATKSQEQKQKQYVTKYDILQTVICLQYQPLDWYGLLEKERRLIRNYMSKNRNQKNYINSKENIALTKYIKNLYDFTTQSDYKLICDAYNKEKIVLNLQQQQIFLHNLLTKQRSKLNQLENISNLGTLFFKGILSYCSLKDIQNTRYVCKKFNQEFEQNSNFYYHIQVQRVQKQIKTIENNFNLCSKQDELLSKTKEQNSLMELFYCIQNQVKLENNIRTQDFLCINSQEIVDAIFKSEIDHEIYSRTRENGSFSGKQLQNPFHEIRDSLTECLMDYYFKLPQLQKKLEFILHLYHETEIRI